MKEWNNEEGRRHRGGGVRWDKGMRKAKRK
jgi:hypothetical protein